MLWSAVQTFTLIILQLCHYTKNPAFRQLVFIAEEGAHSAPTARIIGIGQPLAADLPHKFPPVVEIFAKYYYFKVILYKRLPGSL